MSLNLKIEGAGGLRRGPEALPSSSIDPYCICEIPGKPLSRVATHVATSTSEPTWNFATVVPDFATGDSLEFSVFCRERWPEKDELLGKAILESSSFLPDGFCGELRLQTSSCSALACPMLSMSVSMLGGPGETCGWHSLENEIARLRCSLARAQEHGRGEQGCEQQAQPQPQRPPEMEPLPHQPQQQPRQHRQQRQQRQQRQPSQQQQQQQQQQRHQQSEDQQQPHQPGYGRQQISIAPDAADNRALPKPVSATAPLNANSVAGVAPPLGTREDNGSAEHGGADFPDIAAHIHDGELLFDMLDRHSEGTISRRDARAWLRSLGWCLDNAPLDIMLDEVQDNDVSPSERSSIDGATVAANGKPGRTSQRWGLAQLISVAERRRDFCGPDPGALQRALQTLSSPCGGRADAVVELNALRLQACAYEREGGLSAVDFDELLDLCGIHPSAKAIDVDALVETMVDTICHPKAQTAASPAVAAHHRRGSGLTTCSGISRGASPAPPWHGRGTASTSGGRGRQD